MIARNRLFLNSMLMAAAGLCLSTFLFLSVFGVIHQRTLDEMAYSAVADAQEYLDNYGREISEQFEGLWTKLNDSEFINEVRQTLPAKLVEEQSNLCYARLISLRKFLQQNIWLSEVYGEAAVLYDGPGRDYLCTTSFISDDLERDYRNGLLSFENVSYESFLSLVAAGASPRYIHEPLQVMKWDNRMDVEQSGLTGLAPLRLSSGNTNIYIILLVDVEALQKKLTRFHYAGDYFMLVRQEEVVFATDPQLTLTQHGGIWRDGVSDTMYMCIQLDKLGLSCYLSLNNDAIYGSINNFTQMMRMIPYLFVFTLALVVVLLFARWHYPLIRMAKSLSSAPADSAIDQIHSHIVSLKEENHAMMTRLDQLEPAAYKHLMNRLYTADDLPPADAAQVRKITGLTESRELRCVCIGCLNRAEQGQFEQIRQCAARILPAMTAFAEIDGIFSAIIPWEEYPGKLQDLLGELLEALNSGGKSSYAIGISDTYRGCSGVAQAWKEAHFSWTDALIWQHSSVVSSASLLKTSRYCVDYDQLNNMYQALRAGDVDLALQIFDGLVQQNFYVANDYRLKQLYFRQFYYDIVGVLARVATSYDVSDVLEELFAHSRQVSLEEQTFLLRNALSNCANVIPLKKENDELSSQVCAFCEAHFSEPNLSLSAVAEHFELSESSMSKFFKTHTGVTFSSFIENLRLNHAEELLLDGSLSVRTIAETVGYQNMTTFYNAFKRKHSCTPTQWLNLYASEEGLMH